MAVTEYLGPDGIRYEYDYYEKKLYMSNRTSTPPHIGCLVEGKVMSNADGSGTLKLDVTQAEHIFVNERGEGSSTIYAIIGELGLSQLFGMNNVKDLTIRQAGFAIGVEGDTLTLRDPALPSLEALWVQCNNVIIESGYGYNCPNLTDINAFINLDRYAPKASDPGVLYNKTGTTLIRCPPARLNAYTVDDTVTAIDGEAFKNCVGIRAMVISDSVTSIGANAFDGMYNLTSIRFESESAPTIGANSFKLGTSSHPVVTYVYSMGNWANGVLENYSNSNTTFVYDTAAVEIIEDIPVEIGDEVIFMSNPERTVDFLLYHGSNREYNCIESYTIHGGSEQPFEYITMSINKKQLTALAPDLADRIYAGCNKITLIGPGQGEYIVSTAKKSGQTWSITAYSVSELIRAVTLGQKIDLGAGGAGATTPKDIITSLIYTDISQYYINGLFSLAPIQDSVFLFKTDNNRWESEASSGMVFSKGTSVWYIIQVCALKLGCKVWISHGILYVVDTSVDMSNGVPSNYTLSPGEAPAFVEIPAIYLNRSGDFPYSPTQEQLDFMSNVVDLPSPGKEGPQVLRNEVTVKFDASKDPRLPDSADSSIVAEKDSQDNPQEGAGTSLGTITSGLSNSLVAGSVTAYSSKAYTVEIKEIGLNNARKIAETLAERYCDAETSISFEVRELYKEVDGTDGSIRRVWYPTFPVLTHVHMIADYSNDLTLSTRCNYPVNNTYPILPHKGMLSYAEHNFPKHTSKYTFGISTPTDVSQNNSIILSAINNG